jgi:DNA replication protein DnaC
MLDDLSYFNKPEAKTSVLFESIAHRCERKSLLTTVDRPFGEWDLDAGCCGRSGG